MKKDLTECIKITALIACLFFSSCAASESSPDNAAESVSDFSAVSETETSVSEELSVTAFTEESVTVQSDAEETVPAVSETEDITPPPEELSLSSAQEILDFLSEGDWYFRNKQNGLDYGRLNFSADGNITYERLSDGVCASGNISFENERKNDPAPDRFEICLTSIPQEFSGDSGFIIPGNADRTSGKFILGTASGEDLLYLEEIGSGNTFTFSEVFADPAETAGMSPEYSYNYVLCRKNESRYSRDTVKDGEFYAWCWEHSGGEILLQQMIPEVTEEVDGFVNRKFLSADFFAEENSAVKYVVSDRITDADLLFSQAWNREFPLGMYKVFTDENGTVFSLEEADRSFYGKYDLGTAEQQISVSYDGLSFSLNGIVHNIAEISAVGNAVTDAVQAGRKIVVTVHINPDKSEYVIFDTETGMTEKSIFASEFIWFGDDVTSGVYLLNDSVYNYCGKEIYSSDTEISLVDFSDDGTSVRISSDETSGETYIEIPYEPDLAVSAYRDFIYTRKASDWRRFMEYAPENAALFVITDPDEDIVFYSGNTAAEDNGGYSPEKIAAVSLVDGAKVRMDHGTYNFDDPGSPRWENVERGAAYDIAKGGSRVFDANITEGIPETYIYLYTEDFSVDRPIAVMSGETETKCAFVCITAMG